MPDTSQPPLLVALGDSITAGVGGSWNRGYPTHLHRLLRSHYKDLKLINWGIPGLTITKLRQALDRGEHLYDRIGSATWLVMTIGGNDIIQNLPRDLHEQIRLDPKQQERFARELELLITTIRSLAGCPLYIGDLYNPFPNSEPAEMILNTINRTHLYPLAKKYRNLHLVRVSDVLRGREKETIQYFNTGTIRDMSKWWRRPIHPNNQGHEIMARAFYDRMRKQLPT